MREITINGRKTRVDPARPLRQGGEALVFDYNGMALKLFRTSDDPMFTTPNERELARKRLEEHSRKLPAFPRGLPSCVIAPVDLAMDRSQTVVGFTMPWVVGGEMLNEFGEPYWRATAGVDNNGIVQIFTSLHEGVSGVHDHGVVIGDFTPMNVMVVGIQPNIIDADSMQFGPYQCHVFTQRYVDPLRCDPARDVPFLVKPHNEGSDWYAFDVMLFQTLMLIGPYDGRYKPKGTGKRIKHDARTMKRITIFDPDVQYTPGDGVLSLSVLPDDLLQHFEQRFAKDVRGETPLSLLQSIRWTTCTKCGTEHARGTCPSCSTPHPAMIKRQAKHTKTGVVEADKVFDATGGRIIYASLQNGQLRWLYHMSDQFRREDDRVILNGVPDPKLTFRISGDKTHVGKGSRVITFPLRGNPKRTSVDLFERTLPVFDANVLHRYWTNGGVLYHDDPVLGEDYPYRIGDVVSDVTRFWVGSDFGFGFTRAGSFTMGFIFDAEHQGINDNVQIPAIHGKLIGAHCTFSDRRAWFFTSVQEGTQTVNRCIMIKRDGTVEGTAEAMADDGSWLGTIYGKAGVGNVLFAPTDDGILRIESDGDRLNVANEYPETSGYVDGRTNLFFHNGIYTVRRDQIWHVRMQSS